MTTLIKGWWSADGESSPTGVASGEGIGLDAAFSSGTSNSCSVGPGAETPSASAIAGEACASRGIGFDAGESGADAATRDLPPRPGVEIGERRLASRLVPESGCGGESGRPELGFMKRYTSG